MAGLAAVAILVLMATAIIQFVAWVGAVINTAGLKDKTWFIILLVNGLLSFGFIAMIIYLVAGPEDPPTITAIPAAPGRAGCGRGPSAAFRSGKSTPLSGRRLGYGPAVLPAPILMGHLDEGTDNG
jgi:hypothetical protein